MGRQTTNTNANRLNQVCVSVFFFCAWPRWFSSYWRPGVLPTPRVPLEGGSDVSGTPPKHERLSVAMWRVMWEDLVGTTNNQRQRQQAQPGFSLRFFFCTCVGSAHVGDWGCCQRRGCSRRVGWRAAGCLGGAAQPGHSDSLVLDVPALWTKEEEEQEGMERLNEQVAEGIPVSAAEMATWRWWILCDTPSSSDGKRMKKEKKRKKHFLLDSFLDLREEYPDRVIDDFSAKPRRRRMFLGFARHYLA